MHAASPPIADAFAVARYNMIESQLRPNGVRNELILTAMGALPRELFVPENLEGIAYIDEDIQVAPSRYLLDPMVLARLLEAAAVKTADRVLDIGPATGYSTAVLSAIAASVVAVEARLDLMSHAEHNMKLLGFNNSQVRNAPFADGANGQGPYDLILINGSVDVVPDSLLTQLTEGGRLVTVMRHFGPGRSAHLGEARLYIKQNGYVSHRALFDANVKPLPGMQAARGFDF